ncbi:receptor-like protein kinase 1 [Striga hermonthica]|uniref:Receptor-like protein kinase 1 n=1 Tax=Striga hermonthica TaxID=68872 RepID=A0A9N7MUH9_STRHE|nr:receptor-like protein kinase 1 [Striga hermonthica]
MLATTTIISANAQPQENVTVKSVIVAGGSNSSWKSSSGEFALGFQRVSPHGYLLAITFDQLSEKTIVWAANRDKLAKPGSFAQISADGGLELIGPTGEHIWASNITGPGSVARGTMLDNGNFVLERQDSVVLWQSFNEPTDTLLPGQVLNQNGSLLAGLSETNSSKGRFKLILQEDGNLVLYTINHPMTDPIFAYWSTQTTIGSGYRLIFEQSGYIYVTSKNGTMLYMVFPNKFPKKHFRQRMTLDHDGVLRRYVYPRFANVTRGWPMKWSVDDFQPTNICLRVGGTKGGGVCGYNSLCTLGKYGSPSCSCPDKGYSAVDSTDRMGGCKQDSGNGRFGYVDVANADWPGSEYEWYASVSEEWCRESCLADVYCAAAVVRSGGCWKMGLPLRNGRVNESIGGKSLLKVRL